MLDPLLLRTFLTAANNASFSETARRLGLRQSTISDHIRRLEEQLGRRLFLRDTHSLALTPEGDALIGYAQLILDTGERAQAFFAGSRARRRLRFGASEDVVTGFLPEVLRAFVLDHPEVDLELTVDLSTPLAAGFDAGAFDLVFCKRRPGDERGEYVCRDDLGWVGRRDFAQRREEWGRSERGRGEDGQPDRRGSSLPLIAFRSPSITREIAIAALTRAEIEWRLACASDALSGLTAAALAGLGVTVLAQGLIPPGLANIGPELALPALGAVEFVLLRDPRLARTAAADLAASIIARARS